MFGFFKRRDNDREPIELLDYCKQNDMPGFELLTYIAVCASGLTSISQESSGEEIFNEYFAYLLGKACWIAETNGKFSEQDYHALFSKLPRVAETRFTKNGMSQSIVGAIRAFFAGRKQRGAVPINEIRVGNYCGNFITDIDPGLLKKIIFSSLVETGWNGTHWYGIPLSEQRVDYILKEVFNIKLGLPTNLYEKNDYGVDVEALYDLAIAALVREKYLKENPFFWSKGMFEVKFQLLQKASGIIRETITTTAFNKGLRS